MNPFKHKQLEEFTIEDCESYINRYPYGEHTIEVKQLLKELKKQKAEQPIVANEKSNPQPKKTRETKGKTSTSVKKEKKEEHKLKLYC